MTTKERINTILNEHNVVFSTAALFRQDGRYYSRCRFAAKDVQLTCLFFNGDGTKPTAAEVMETLLSEYQTWWNWDEDGADLFGDDYPTTNIKKIKGQLDRQARRLLRFLQDVGIDIDDLLFEGDD